MGERMPNFETRVPDVDGDDWGRSIYALSHREAAEIRAGLYDEGNDRVVARGEEWLEVEVRAKGGAEIKRFRVHGEIVITYSARDADGQEGGGNEA